MDAIERAEEFLWRNARLLERLRFEHLFRDGDPGAVVAALRPYQRSDGGFGHALEPDVRAPQSEPAATLHALEVLSGIGALDDPMVAGGAAWVASIAAPDGGVPFVMPTAAEHPHAPWMVPSDGGSHLTFALAGKLWEAGSGEPWLRRATEWCWAKLDRPDQLGSYWVKFALDFLDSVPDEARAGAAIEQLRPRIEADGSIAVAGGTANERLTPLMLSERPGARSRALFTDEQIEADLDRLQQGQQDDGGWTFDWLAWSPGQTVEWRGALTLWVLFKLRAHGKLS
jgi:hypothetical protein